MFVLGKNMKNKINRIYKTALNNGHTKLVLGPWGCGLEGGPLKKVIEWFSEDDLSDLYEKIRWCKNNDEKCQQIAQNAYIFYQTFLCKKGILDYLQNILLHMNGSPWEIAFSMLIPFEEHSRRPPISLLDDQSFFQSPCHCQYVSLHRSQGISFSHPCHHLV